MDKPCDARSFMQFGDAVVHDYALTKGLNFFSAPIVVGGP
jgi:hypothetical protein